MNGLDTSTDAELLTTDEVMNILLVNADLRRRAATCVLPAVRCDTGEFRFRRSDLISWISRQHAALATASRAS
jgi:hypothetical protein